MSAVLAEGAADYKNVLRVVSTSAAFGALEMVDDTLQLSAEE